MNPTTERPFAVLADPPPAPCRSEPYDQLRAVLLACGYREGYPPAVGARAVAIDAEACSAMSCPECWTEGLGYVPFAGPAGEYLALALCRCGHAEEI